MPTIDVECSECATILAIREDQLGAELKCPKCKSVFLAEKTSSAYRSRRPGPSVGWLATRARPLRRPAGRTRVEARDRAGAARTRDDGEVGRGVAASEVEVLILEPIAQDLHPVRPVGEDLDPDLVDAIGEVGGDRQDGEPGVEAERVDAADEPGKAAFDLHDDLARIRPDRPPTRLGARGRGGRGRGARAVRGTSGGRGGGIRGRSRWPGRAAGPCRP